MAFVTMIQGGQKIKVRVTKSVAAQMRKDAAAKMKGSRPGRGRKAKTERKPRQNRSARQTKAEDRNVARVNSEQVAAINKEIDRLFKETGLASEPAGKEATDRKRTVHIVEPLCNRLNVGKREEKPWLRCSNPKEILARDFDKAIEILKSSKFRRRLDKVARERNIIISAARKEPADAVILQKATKVPMVYLRSLLQEMETENTLRTNRLRNRGGTYQYIANVGNGSQRANAAA